MLLAPEKTAEKFYSPTLVQLREAQNVKKLASVYEENITTKQEYEYTPIPFRRTLPRKLSVPQDIIDKDPILDIKKQQNESKQDFDSTPIPIKTIPQKLSVSQDKVDKNPIVYIKKQQNKSKCTKGLCAICKRPKHN